MQDSENGQQRSINDVGSETFPRSDLSAESRVELTDVRWHAMLITANPRQAA